MTVHGRIIPVHAYLPAYLPISLHAGVCTSRIGQAQNKNPDSRENILLVKYWHFDRDTRGTWLRIPCCCQPPSRVDAGADQGCASEPRPSAADGTWCVQLHSFDYKLPAVERRQVPSIIASPIIPFAILQHHTTLHTTHKTQCPIHLYHPCLPRRRATSTSARKTPRTT